MNNVNVAKPSVMQRLIDRVGNPLEWTYVDKGLFLLLLDLFWKITIALFGYFENPYIGPTNQNLTAAFINYSAHLIFGKYFLAAILVQTVLIVISLIIRKRQPNSRIPAYGYAILVATVCTLLAVGLGHSTNLITALIPFWLVIIGMVFFDIVFVFISIFIFISILITSMILESLGIIPYAYLLHIPPYDNGMIHTRWISMNLSIIGSVGPVMLTIIGYIFNRWRQRETQVTGLSELLKKMFGRYLSTEVMSSLIEDPSLLELGGERKEVTIMMTDLRGFTALSERLKPEQVVQMLNSYFEIMVETVLKYKGTINEIIGDALLVIFGAPQDMSDQAKRAIACSIEMQNAMTEVNKENRLQNLPDLEMGIGINKAEVIIGNIGSSKRSKYTVVGSGVNMASRIESYTVGGQILISDTVLKEAGTKLRIDGEQEVYPKGSETPIKIFEVGGIADQYNLVLEYEDTDVVKLQQKIPFQYSILGGKHIRKENLKGNIVSLSKKSAEVKIDVSADLLTNLKMDLINVGDELRSKDIYGKIIDQSGEDNFVIRFTSVPPEISSYFHAYRNHAS